MKLNAATGKRGKRSIKRGWKRCNVKSWKFANSCERPLECLKKKWEKGKERARETGCSKIGHGVIERGTPLKKWGRNSEGTRKTGNTRLRKREEVKVSLVKRMEAKKENYIKKLERSRVWWYSAAGMQHGELSEEWSVSLSPLFFFYSPFYF